jgi:hypothetical protein
MPRTKPAARQRAVEPPPPRLVLATEAQRQGLEYIAPTHMGRPVRETPPPASLRALVSPTQGLDDVLLASWLLADATQGPDRLSTYARVGLVTPSPWPFSPFSDLRVRQAVRELGNAVIAGGTGATLAVQGKDEAVLLAYWVKGKEGAEDRDGDEEDEEDEEEEEEDLSWAGDGEGGTLRVVDAASALGVADETAIALSKLVAFGGLRIVLEYGSRAGAGAGAGVGASSSSSSAPVQAEPPRLCLYVLRSLFVSMPGAAAQAGSFASQNPWKSLAALLQDPRIVGGSGGGGGEDDGADATPPDDRCAVVVPPLFRPRRTDAAAQIPSPSSSATAQALTEQDVYAAACPLPGEDVPEADLGSASYDRLRSLLRPTLRHYQLRGLHWLTARENALASDVLGQSTGAVAGSPSSPYPGALYSVIPAGAGGAPSSALLLHPLWFAFRPPPHPFAISSSSATSSRPLLFGSPFSGLLSRTPAPPPATKLAAGIFADEMGLGKTVCTLALVATTDAARAQEVTTAMGTATPAEDAAARMQALAARREAATGGGGCGAHGGQPEEDGSGIACICGTTYRDILPFDQSPAMLDSKQGRKALQAQERKRRKLEAAGSSASSKASAASAASAAAAAAAAAAENAGPADKLSWIQCAACRRWQHAVCGGWTEEEAAERSDPFLCPECESACFAGKPLAATSNLVICPVPILKQWQAEIRKHTFAEDMDADATMVAPLPPSSSSSSSSSSTSAHGGGSLRVLYYAGVKSTLSALRSCTGALTRLRGSLEDLEREEARFARRAGYDEEDAEEDEDEELSGGTGSGGVTQPHDASHDAAIEGAAAEAVASGTGVGATEGAVVIGGVVFDFAGPTAATSSSSSTPRGGGKRSSLAAAPTRKSVKAALAETRRAIRSASAAAIRLSRSLSPTHLASADIVITTYSALEDDIHHADSTTAEVLHAAGQIGMLVGALPRGTPASSTNMLVAGRLAKMLAGDASWPLPITAAELADAATQSPLAAATVGTGAGAGSASGRGSYGGLLFEDDEDEAVLSDLDEPPALRPAAPGAAAAAASASAAAPSLPAPLEKKKSPVAKAAPAPAPASASKRRRAVFVVDDDEDDDGCGGGGGGGGGGDGGAAPEDDVEVLGWTAPAPSAAAGRGRGGRGRARGGAAKPRGGRGGGLRRAAAGNVGDDDSSGSSSDSDYTGPRRGSGGRKKSAATAATAAFPSSSSSSPSSKAPAYVTLVPAPVTAASTAAPPTYSSSSSSTALVDLSSGASPKRSRDRTGLGIMVDETGAIRGDTASVGVFALHAGLSVGSGARKLRHAKKYRVVPTPLLQVHWYRVLLDEAQLIDAPVAKAALMAQRLWGVNRWAISGTPLARTVSDLFGLLLFLGIPPYDSKEAFNRAVLPAAEANADPVSRRAFLRLAHALVWRTRKADVAGELGVPPVTDEVVLLRPSRIEEAFYRREFRRILSRVEPVLAAWKKEEREAGARALAGPALSPEARARRITALRRQPLGKREQAQVLLPLLSLRQACVHPQIGAQGLGRRGTGGEGRRGAGAAGPGGGGVGGAAGGAGAGAGASGPMSMLAVLDSMIAKAAVDCEEAHRDIIASHNGLAGLEWLAGRAGSGLSHYQRVVDAGRAAAAVGGKTGAYGGKLVVAVDSLPRIHAIRNMLELMDEQKEEEEADGADGAAAAPAGSLTSALHRDRLDREASLLEEDFLRSAGYLVLVELGQVEKATRAALLPVLSLEEAPASSATTTKTPAASAAAQGAKSSSLLRLRVLDDEENDEGMGAGAASSSSSSAPAVLDLTTDSGAAAASRALALSELRTGRPVDASRAAAVFSPLRATSGPLDTLLLVAAETLFSRAANSAIRVRELLDISGVRGIPGEDYAGAAGGGGGGGGGAAAAAPSLVADGAGSLAWKATDATGLKFLVVATLGELSKARARALATVQSTLVPTSADVSLSANCRQCRADWKKMGPVCGHCRAKAPLRMYLANLVGSRVQSIAGAGGDLEAQPAVYSSTGRRKRLTKRTVPGAAGNLSAWLEGEDVDGGDADEGGASGAGGGKSASASAAAAAAMEELSEKFAVPTALARTLKCLANMGRGTLVDVGEVLEEALAEAAEKGKGAGKGKEESDGEGSSSFSSSSSSSSRAQAHPLVLALSEAIPPGAESVVRERSSGPPPVIEVDAGAFVERVLQVLEAEARRFLRVWRAQGDLLATLDELSQAMTRMALAPEGVPLTETEELYLVPAAEIPTRVGELTARLAASDTDFKKAKGHLVYLLNIKEEETGAGGGGPGNVLQSPTEASSSAAAAGSAGAASAATAASSSSSSSSAGPDSSADSPAVISCIICQDELGGGTSEGQIAILPCGHRFCKTCIRNFLRAAAPYATAGTAKCPQCRLPFQERSTVYARRQLGGAAAVSASAAEPVSAAAAAGALSPTTASGSAASSSAAEAPPSAAVAAAAAPAPRRSDDAEAAPPTVGPDGTLAHLFTRSSAALSLISASEAEALSVVGSYGMKVEALVRALRALRSGADLSVGESMRRKFGGAGEDAEMATAAAPAPKRPRRRIGAGVSESKGDDDDDEDEEEEDDEEEAGTAPTSQSSSSSSAALRQALAARRERRVKSLVFSQWDEALQIAEAALVRNDIPCLRLTSARKTADLLERFVSDPSIDVLLLPFKSGAEGLNITAATHVFFLEPLLEPSVEQQAIGRVHRMGQTQPTFVHRLVVKGTVEETVLALGKHRLRRRHRRQQQQQQQQQGAAGDGEDISEATDADDAAAGRGAGAGAGAASSSGPAASSSRKGGADDSGAVTRADVLKLFEAEAAFARQLTELGAAATAADGGPAGTAAEAGGAAAAAAAAAAAPTEDAPANAAAASASSSSSSRGRAGRTRPRPGEDEDEDEGVEDDEGAAGGGKGVSTPSAAVQNHSFWQGRVLAARGSVVNRLAWLTQRLPPSSSSGAGDVTTVFGRAVPSDLARELLGLREVPAAGAAAGTV